MGRITFNTHVEPITTGLKVPRGLTAKLAKTARVMRAETVSITDTETGDWELTQYARDIWTLTINRIRSRSWLEYAQMLFHPDETPAIQFMSRYLPHWARVICWFVHRSKRDTKGRY